MILVEDLLIDGHGLIEFVIPAEMIRPIVQIHPLVIIQSGQGLLCAAVFAFHNGLPGLDFQRSAAHFTFEN